MRIPAFNQSLLHGQTVVTPSIQLANLNRRSYRPATPYFLVILLPLFQISQLTTAFNINWYHPIIIKATDPVTRFGDSEASIPTTYFGASVEFLKSEGESYSWVIVGAPKANTTQAASSFPQHQNIPEPGQIWQCTLGRIPEICRPVVMDPTGNFHHEEIHEWKNNSFLGGPNGIAVNSKSFVACASRMERWDQPKSLKNTTVSFMHGTCYVRPRKDLLLPQFNLPPPARLLDDNNFQRLNPLRDNWYESRNEKRHGQAGFSVHLSKSGTELVMSAPGLRRWMGSIIQYISQDGGETYTKAAVSEADKCSESGQGCSQYFGYSVTSGYFYQTDVARTMNNAPPLYYAAGAPRGNNFAGKVITFRFPSQSNGREVRLAVKEEIVGSQIGAYFGSSLLSVDLNNDGFDDLLVGSPRFSRKRRIVPRSDGEPQFDQLTKDGYQQFQEYGDEGAVFIYFSSNQSGGNLTQHKITLQGGNRPWSHFGTAMTSVGDLNRDGYNDFAVSAPFEDATGTVYIYHGNRNALVKNVPAQVIRGKQVDPGLRGFGFSLTGNEDIDNNGFNDLAIGSIKSSQVVVLRSKPIISVKSIIRSDLSTLPLNIDTFIVKSCVSYAGDHVLSSLILQIYLEADADVPHRRVSIRRADATGFGRPNHFLEYIQTVRKAEEESCTKFNVTVREPLESSKAPVVFRQTVTIPQPVENAIVTPRVLSIETKSGALHTSGANFFDFCKTCPIIDYDKSEDGKLELPLAINCGKDEICQANLNLKVSFLGVDPSAGSFIVGSVPSVRMAIILSNSNEPAIQPAVLVTWRKLKLKRNPAGCIKYSEKESEITYKCALGKIMNTGESATVVLEFDLTSLYASGRDGQMEKKLVWNVTALTLSHLVNPVRVNISLPLSYQADPYITGSRRMEVFNVKTLWKYLEFTHIFEINLDGPSPVADIEAVFHLPVDLTTKNEKIHVVNVRGVKVFSDNEDAPTLSCQVTIGQFSRKDEALKTNQVETDDQDPEKYDMGGIAVILPKEKEVNRGSNSTLIENGRLLLHCNSPHVTCMEVTCKAAAVHVPRTTTKVTFIMDIAADDIRRLFKTMKVSAIQVESRGNLSLSSVIKGIQPESHKSDETIADTLIEKEGHKPISFLIYILGVIIGIAILLCVVAYFARRGCFKNEKPTTGTAEEMTSIGNGGENSVEGNNDEPNQTSSLLHSNRPISDVPEPPDFIPVERKR